MDFKTSLDRYLTSDPFDYTDLWFEEVLGDKISNQFYEDNEYWIENDPQIEKWLNKLFDSGKTQTEAAMIIERAFNIFIKNKHE